jgi:protein gp37
VGEETKIQWCHHTLNMWIGCTKVSAGCKACYASVSTPVRVLRAKGEETWGADAERHETKEWARNLRRWNREALASKERRRVFCASLADVFEDHQALPEKRARLWPELEAAVGLDIMLLTKRPENVLGMVPSAWLRRWPAHVWLGTTVEDQEQADRRIPLLLRIPARVKFLSCEPLLEQIDIRRYLDERGREGVSGTCVARLVRGTQRRDDLASHGVSRLELRTIDDVGVSAQSGGEHVGAERLSSGGVLGFRDSEEGECAPDRVDGDKRPVDSDGHGDQPHRRREVQQRSDQFGIGVPFRECGTRDHDSRSEVAKGRHRRPEFAGQALARAGGGDPNSMVIQGNDPNAAGREVRRRAGEHIGDRARQELEARGIDWVIVGGESGPNARPFELAWARSLRDQCKATGTAYFFKQAGSNIHHDGYQPAGGWWPKGTRMENLPGDHGNGWRVLLKDSHGGDLAELPEDLRIREFPAVAKPPAPAKAEPSIPVQP